MRESIVYFSLKVFGQLIRLLPISIALWIGRVVGWVAYYFDLKHRTQAYSNLKMAFGEKKSFDEIKRLTKQVFKNFGQNIVELLRMPKLNKDNFENHITIEGREHIDSSLKKGKGVILLAMHFGSWELASISCAMMGYPYKVFVKSQAKYSKLNELLNSYRSCGGSVVLTRGVGTRDLIKSLKNNEVIGMVVDQGGRDGVLVPFFGREATMSAGAIRMALKSDIPVCFSIIVRDKGAKHRVIISEPLELSTSGEQAKDVEESLKQITQQMEKYIVKYPSQYMWFYKIWKYSKEANVTILSDGKVGHLRQSECIANNLKKALLEREINANIKTITLAFKSKLVSRLFSVFSFFSHPLLVQGRLGVLRWFLDESSYRDVMLSKSDFIVSTGSSMAGINYLLSIDQNAKSIVNLKPGIHTIGRFDMVILPKHDLKGKKMKRSNMAITKGAPNLISNEYLDEQEQKIYQRYSHLKTKLRSKIGIFIGGNSKNVFLTEQQIKVLLRQIREVSKEINADVLITTSRRTPVAIERLIKNQIKKDEKFILSIFAHEENVPEAVGGILALSDIVVVSGDSISMICEAASSGKQTIVFLPQFKEIVLKKINKHQMFIKSLDKQGYILSTTVQNLGHTIYDIAKSKMHTRTLDDNKIIYEAVKKVI